MRAFVHTPQGVKGLEIADPPPPLIANLFVHCGVIMPTGVHVYRAQPWAGGRTCAQSMPPMPRDKYTTPEATLIPYAGRE
jgi:hypothetical protein